MGRMAAIMALRTAVRTASSITDDVRFPAAMTVDAADRVPAGHAALNPHPRPSSR
jgi:hypothetical protein